MFYIVAAGCLLVVIRLGSQLVVFWLSFGGGSQLVVFWLSFGGGHGVFFSRAPITLTNIDIKRGADAVP